MTAPFRDECAATRELFADHWDATLDTVRAQDVARHLFACRECADSYRAYVEVLSVLRVRHAAEPPAELAERSFAASVAARRTLVAHARRRPVRRLALLQAAAAVAMVVTGGYALAAGPDSRPVRGASEFVERTTDEVAAWIETTDLWLDDLKLLHVAVETAFERRLDRVKESVDDYRRLLEERREREGERGRDDSGSLLDRAPPRLADVTLSNLAGSESVT